MLGDYVNREQVCISLPASGTVLLGRGAASTAVIRSAEVSREHCQITISAAGVVEVRQ